MQFAYILAIIIWVLIRMNSEHVWYSQSIHILGVVAQCSKSGRWWWWRRRCRAYLKWENDIFDRNGFTLIWNDFTPESNVLMAHCDVEQRVADSVCNTLMRGGEKWKNQHKEDRRFIHTYRPTSEEIEVKRQIDGLMNGRRKDSESLAGRKWGRYWTIWCPYIFKTKPKPQRHTKNVRWIRIGAHTHTLVHWGINQGKCLRCGFSLKKWNPILMVLESERVHVCVVKPAMSLPLSDVCMRSTDRTECEYVELVNIWPKRFIYRFH